MRDVVAIPSGVAVAAVFCEGALNGVGLCIGVAGGFGVASVRSKNPSVLQRESMRSLKSCTPLSNAP